MLSLFRFIDPFFIQNKKGKVSRVSSVPTLHSTRSRFSFHQRIRLQQEARGSGIHSMRMKSCHRRRLALRFIILLFCFYFYYLHSVKDPDYPAPVSDGYLEKCPCCCDETFPKQPSNELKKVYSTYCSKYDLVYNKGRNAHQVKIATSCFEVCKAIEAMKGDPELHNKALQNDWPLAVDFKALPMCIINTSQEITSIFENKIVLANCAWKSFIRCLSAQGISFAKFLKLADIVQFDVVWHHAHGG